MQLSELHAALLARAFGKVLGRPERGSMAFVRCLAPDVVLALAAAPQFAPAGWEARRVADTADPTTRTIRADQAVELRESKGNAVLLLVDPERAGAGMDGIYSAALEVTEEVLFKEALSLAAREVSQRLSAWARKRAEEAIKRTRGHGQRFSSSPWSEFYFLAAVAAENRSPGELLHRIGLWPIACEAEGDFKEALNLSRALVDQLLGVEFAGWTPATRITALRLLNPSSEQLRDLERFVRESAAVPRLDALARLSELPHLWVGPLQFERVAQTVQDIELTPWRGKNGKLAKWSGLQEPAGENEPPLLVLDPKAHFNGNYAQLEVRWKTRPENVEKGTVAYRVAIATDFEELTARDVVHSGSREQKCRFTDDDFHMLGDDANLAAYVVVTVPGKEEIQAKTEEFQICIGERTATETAGTGRKVRALCEGAIELDEREHATQLADAAEALQVDKKGNALVRSAESGKSFRVGVPALIRDVEQQWQDNGGAIGRWRVRVRASGARTGRAEFLPMNAAGEANGNAWDRVAAINRRLIERFAARSGCCQLYDQNSKYFENVVKEYLLAWTAALEDGDPCLALAHTVEVQSLSGKTVGLIVLPSHPLRVAWHVGYDNLVLHARFENNLAARNIREELQHLDGAMFPAFLPGLAADYTFVFADTLGFHAVGMVSDQDKEPKASLALLARALGEAESAEAAPTVGRQSAQVLGDEIVKYLECHRGSRFLHIHALRAGDGLTVARALGRVQQRYAAIEPDEAAEPRAVEDAPAFVLELYPSREQRVIAGKFIAESREKRRTGAGVLAEEDRWMLEAVTLPGEVNVPRLRWARKEKEPESAAHLAVAFDTFESRVVVEDRADSAARPYYVYGLASFFEREYHSLPSPVWQSRVREPEVGEKHPADRSHTDRLVRLQAALQGAVARHKNAPGRALVLRTEISPEKADNLRQLHRLCDWVITLDRNAGIEYFDSPQDNREIYDAYVIDCVPEREDLGCLQLITSTSNLDEVRNLLDGTLAQMGLSHSRRNAEFLMEHLKALSGRLAIRLTGQQAPTSELIALALCQAQCRQAEDDDECWLSLREGFLIPVDDVRDLLPPVNVDDGAATEPGVGLAVRPDLIYVTTAPRKGLSMSFVEVKHRRHLHDARGGELLEQIRQQVETLQERWRQWYELEEAALPFRAMRRAKLARVLRFYADKARRHADDESGRGLSAEAYRALVAEIDRMIVKGGEYSFAEGPPNRGWVFCPEYAGVRPTLISPAQWQTKVYLFGPSRLPDCAFASPQFPVAEALPSAPSGQEEVDQPTGAPRDKMDAPRAETASHEPTTEPPASDAGAGGKPTIAPPAPESEPRLSLGSDLLGSGEVQWSLSLKGNPHLLVAGLPGMGKTTCLLNICKQMLAAGVRPIVFSYHQDIDERLTQFASDIRFIDFQGLGFNPLEVIDPQPLGYLDVAGTLRDIFLAIFPELGDIQGNELRNAAKQAFVESGWDNPDIPREHLQTPPFKRVLEILKSHPRPDRGLRTLLARLDELADYGFFNLAAEFRSLWDSTCPTVIRVHRTQNDVLQKAFASLVFYKLYKDMFRRGIQTRLTHAIIFDEAHRAARLTLIPTMAKECRKFGICLVLASQEARDFHSSIFSAIANYLVLRVTEADAKALVRNVASSDQERSLMDKIKQLERFKALYFSEQRRKPCLVALHG